MVADVGNSTWVDRRNSFMESFSASMGGNNTVSESMEEENEVEEDDASGFSEVEDGFKLLDLPGYGFAKSGHSRKKDWGPLLGEYFKNRKALKAALIFMDIRHPLKPIDLEMIELCESFDVPYIPVLTKSDKVSKNILMKTIQLVSKTTNAMEVLAISSSKETGFEKLRKILIGLKDD